MTRTGPRLDTRDVRADADVDVVFTALIRPFVPSRGRRTRCFTPSSRASRGVFARARGKGHPSSSRPPPRSRDIRAATPPPIVDRANGLARASTVVPVVVVLTASPSPSSSVPVPTPTAAPSPRSSPRARPRLARVGRVVTAYEMFAHANTASAAYAVALPGGRRRERTYAANVIVARASSSGDMRATGMRGDARRRARTTTTTTTTTRALVVCACACACAWAWAATREDDDDDDGTRDGWAQKWWWGDDGRDGRDGRRRRRGWVVRTAMSTLVPLDAWVRRTVRRWLDTDGTGGTATANGFVDPSLPIYVVGATSCKQLERRLGKELWEWFVDALSVSPTSPGRARLAAVLSDARTTAQLDETFDELAKRYPREGDEGDGGGEDDDGVVSLSAAALVKFSDGITGSIRPVLAPHDSAVEIRPATESEHAFLLDNFDLLFPPSDPLDRSTWHALAKLIFVRRIIKALVADFGGLVAVQRGLAEPLVVDVRVVLDGDVVFRVHTVAPKSDASDFAGRRLGVISEDA